MSDIVDIEMKGHLIDSLILTKVLDKKPVAVPPLAQIKGAVEAKAVEVKAADLAKKKAEELSVELRYMGPEEFGKFMVSEDARYKELIITEKMGDRYK